MEHRRARMTGLFECMDFDHNGSVDLDEFYDVGEAFTRWKFQDNSFEFDRDAADHILHTVFHGTDANSNHVLERGELVEWGVQFHPHNLAQFDQRIDEYIQACKVVQAERLAAGSELSYRRNRIE